MEVLKELKNVMLHDFITNHIFLAISTYARTRARMCVYYMSVNVRGNPFRLNSSREHENL